VVVLVALAVVARVLFQAVLVALAVVPRASGEVLQVVAG
jgi:hypothetical protein